MKTRNRVVMLASFAVAATVALNVSRAQEESLPVDANNRLVVEVKPDRIILLDAAMAGERAVAVGERGIAMLSDDGVNWRAVQTNVTRTLAGVAFADEKVGVAVGHGATLVRTEDGGESWTYIPMPEAEPESLLGVTYLGEGHFIVYGAFGMYFHSTDAGRTWERGTVISDDFDRHISQVIPVDGKLLMVAESGILARSDDRGYTWTLLESPYEGSYFAAVEAKDGSVLAFGMRGNVYRSTNFASAELVLPVEEEPAGEEEVDEYAEEEPVAASGVEWQEVPLDTTASLMAGRVLSDGRVLLVGNSGLVAVSGDNGKDLHLHWTASGSGIAQVLEKDGKLLTFGERGVGELDPTLIVIN